MKLLTRILAIVLDIFNLLKGKETPPESDQASSFCTQSKTQESKMHPKYGLFVSRDTEGLVTFDEDGLKVAFSHKCRDINDIKRYCPFFELNNDEDLNEDEDDDFLYCSFCPGKRLKYVKRDTDHKAFSNAKKVIVKHVLSFSHKTNVVQLIKRECERQKIHDKSMLAGKHIFASVYGGMKEGFSIRLIQREITVKFKTGTDVGTINHSAGSISKFKKSIAAEVRSMVKSKFSEHLPCSSKPRPVLEIVDK